MKINLGLSFDNVIGAIWFLVLSRNCTNRYIEIGFRYAGFALSGYAVLRALVHAGAS